MKKPIPFGKYVLLERINVGGMAEVFKAKAFGVEGFERLVAVKRILPSIAEDQEFITMFIDEAKIAVQLTHANIAQIFDLGKVADSFFIAMEFVHGKDLRAIFDRARKRGETVPVPMACYTVMKVCEGLDYAHNKKDAAGRELNLVHRDVSPQNILISYDGETKIIDFGIAKAAGKAGKTQAGILKGKFGYMSPEQVRGLPLDRRSDIFAVGIVLYELLTGERLFVGESDFSTLEKVRNVEIMPPSTYNRRIPEELEQIVLKALAKDVDDRYQTAMDLHDDLQSFMYTSGNFFSRKDLSAYMRKAFAEEIARESQREEEYRRMEAEAGLAAPGGRAPKSSGLDAFADIEPAPAKAANISAAQPPPAPRQQKRTMMGVGVPPPPPRTSGAPPPPPPPRTTSPPAVPPTLRSSNPPPPPSHAVSSPGAALDMDWDDEELSTQIYDKPEDGFLPSLPDLNDAAPSPAMASAPEPVVAHAPTPAPSPFAPTLPGHGGSVPGMPSPFDDLPPEPVPVGREPTAVTQPTKKSGGSGGMIAVFGLVAVLALVLLGAGGWWFFLRSQPGTIHLATNPPDAVVYLDNEPITSSTSSPFLLANVEPGEHLVEVRKHGFQTWATRVTLASGQTLELPSVSLTEDAPAGTTGGGGGTTPTTNPEVAGTGFHLDTVPSGALVFVGDRQLPQRTPVTVTDLSPGTVTIRAELENYAPWTGQIDIATDTIAQLPRAVLTLRQVSVRFESNPSGARVTLVRGSERRRVGETPITYAVDTSGSQWTVEMAHGGYEDWTQALNPPSGQANHTVSADLVERQRSTGGGGRRGGGGGGGTQVASGGGDTQTSSGGGGGGGGGAATGGTGTLRVQTTPWSQVYVDGRLIGNTPQMNISLPAGRHQVRLINADFNIRESVSVTIRAGQVETLIRRLTPG
ncbi:MAG: serine/threonine protein kinase [Sandaracinaceae bacterium]|nr:serine/threonine protein kinase [Sandaracinaceae bacterium]